WDSLMAGKVLMRRYDILSQQLAETVAEQLKNKPESCLGLPTGRSPQGCYKLLGQWSQAGKVDWSRASCFALDDYMEADESISFQTFLETHLYKFTNLTAGQKHNPRDVDDYDSLIEQHGGLDLTLLGLGTNGHIAFNEPHTPLESFTHCIWLTESTRTANKSYFPENVTIPHRAISMGIRTILNSKRIILVVSGKNKKQALEKSLCGTPAPAVPASFLCLHPNLTVIKDFE
ncbi:MAG TPA: 6-phosphogluconolactonase, partial [Chroococcales cyanobacterium]